MADRGKHRYNRILKYRQGGITTEYCIELLDDAMWIPGMSCAILAHERSAVTKIFEIVKRAYDNVHPAIQPKTRYDTKQELQFTQRFDGLPLDSSIYVALKVRSGTVQRLHITEIAYIKDYQELKAGSKQAVPLTGAISEETTGNGLNEFYDDYMAALNNPDPTPYDYKAYFYPWVIDQSYSLPGILDEKTPTELEIIRISKKKYNVDVTDGQLIWRRWKMKELLQSQTGIGLSGDQLFKQEYPLTINEAFQSGAGNVFDLEKVDQIVPRKSLSEDEGIAWLSEKFPNDNTKIEQFKALYRQGVKFWHLPEPGRSYVSGVDPSDGAGADYGPIDIWDDEVEVGEKIRQCAQYYGMLRPDELAQVTADLSTFYNRAYAGVENNMLTTILFLSKVYDNYYFETKQDEKTLKRTKKLGWNTNTKTRDIMIDDFNILFDELELEVNSVVTLGEMKTFVKKDNGKREHADGKHDDALFAGFIAIQMRKLKRRKARVFGSNPLQWSK